MTQFVVPALAAGEGLTIISPRCGSFEGRNFVGRLCRAAGKRSLAIQQRNFFLAPLLTDNGGDLHRLSPLIERS
jgi:hypothetical protein